MANPSSGSVPVAVRRWPAAAALVALLTACSSGPQPGPTTAPATAPTPAAAEATGEPAPSGPEVLFTDLDVPWGLDFLPDDSALVTERDTARVYRMVPGEQPEVLTTIPDVATGKEAGLLGVVVSPDVADNGHVFVYYTTADDNRVLRMVLDGDELRPDVVILDGIPRETRHSGGRLAFGPDGYLYVTTGDATEPYNSQDKQSLGGKILRVDEDGEPAEGNPFDGSPIWSMGHRNVQGLGWAEDATMYASEFGEDTWDELNLIEPGNNYGWPEIEGMGGGDEYVDPLAQWAPEDASPSGLAVTDDAIYIAALRGESLWRVPLGSGAGLGDPERLLAGEYGRLRTVEVAPDGRLWLVTSNTFRGDPRDGDDQIIALDEDWLTGG